MGGLKLGQWTSARAEDKILRYEKARKTALGIAQGVVLADLDQQRSQALAGQQAASRQFQREEETARIHETQVRGAQQRADRTLAREQFLREQGLAVE